MTTKELKSEIQKSLDNAPESVLIAVLEFLKKGNQTPDLAKNFKKILLEDKDLLERLAK